jgi:hypothetical protein
MERKDIIKKLVKEGMSEKTLANFNDKQIVVLANRMLSEEMKKGSVVMPKSTATPNDIDRFTKAGQNVELREKLIGGQKKLDKNHNGKLDSQDFKMMQSSKESEIDEDSWDSKSVQRAYRGVSGGQRRSHVSGNQDALDVNSDRFDGKIPKFADKIYADIYNSEYNPETGELELRNDANMDNDEDDDVDGPIGNNSTDNFDVDNNFNDDFDVNLGNDNLDDISIDEDEDMSFETPKNSKYRFFKDLQSNPDFMRFKENNMYDDDNIFESKKRPSAGLSKEKKSDVVKKAKEGKDIGKKGKTFKDIEAKAKATGAKNPKAVAGAAMWKNIKREPKKTVSEKIENVEMKKWLNNIVESEYHPFTSKGEILSLIKSKINK